MIFKNTVRWIGQVDHLAYFDVMEKIEEYTVKNNEPITLLIDSEGGFLQIAFDFIEEIRINAVVLRTIIVGRADSAAVPIAIFGRERFMTKNSHIFLHPLHFSRKENKEKKRNLTRWYWKMISNNSELSIEEVKNLMERKVLLKAQEAKEFGLIDKII